MPVLLSRPDSPTPSERECGCRWVKALSSRLLSSPSTPRPSARPTWQSWRTPWTCGESARYAAGVAFYSALHQGTQSLPDKRSKENLQTIFCYFSQKKASLLFICFFYWLLRGGETRPERFWERSYKTLFTLYSSVSLKSNNQNVDSESLTRIKRWKTLKTLLFFKSLSTIYDENQFCLQGFQQRRVVKLDAAPSRYLFT